MNRNTKQSVISPESQKNILSLIIHRGLWELSLDDRKSKNMRDDFTARVAIYGKGKFIEELCTQLDLLGVIHNPTGTPPGVLIPDGMGLLEQLGDQPQRGADLDQFACTDNCMENYLHVLACKEILDRQGLDYGEKLSLLNDLLGHPESDQEDLDLYNHIAENHKKL